MEKENQQKLQSTSNVHLTKPIRCIVKLGGSAITCKNELETINEENLKTVSRQLRQTMMVSDSSCGKVLGMDWSKRPGFTETSCVVDDFCDQPALDFCHFMVVHGAGSFGHFQASKSGVHKGGLSRLLVKAGFVATPLLDGLCEEGRMKEAGEVFTAMLKAKVTSLNLEIVRALAREGVPSIGMSPFACGWLTCERNIASADVSMVAKAIDSGFVPVMHGDAVLDAAQACTILSGDVIIRHLAEQFKPEFVVFLTDVLGVYDRPPTEPNAVLLREIEVREDGSWSVVKPTLENMNKRVEITVAAHDTTGGMETKISEAAAIAKLGIDVYIVKAATSHSLRALSGELKDNIPEDWLGTVIRRQWLLLEPSRGTRCLKSMVDANKRYTRTILSCMRLLKWAIVLELSDLLLKMAIYLVELSHWLVGKTLEKLMTQKLISNQGSHVVSCCSACLLNVITTRWFYLHPKRFDRHPNLIKFFTYLFITISPSLK
ncbi:hypothetical protein HYC85_023393 [Camellia sinensis]|uniref:Isopentenyl phosphate kinase n=1 Tax=Camellia sinensis TaxID=4442 RepID=A0A7J7GI90_CAMSI|nr:hypothetical protein HYC85_023393 [Camellia sinensis]